jgi:hypothetical protein
MRGVFSSFLEIEVSRIGKGIYIFLEQPAGAAFSFRRREVTIL